MKQTIGLFVVLLLFFSCSNQENTVQEQDVQSQYKLLTRAQINSIIYESIDTTGDFNWSDQSVNTIYSALILGDSVLTVGYQDIKNKTSNNSVDVKTDLINIIGVNEPKQKSTANNSNELFTNDEINVFDITVTNRKTIALLLKDSRVRYIEPTGYHPGMGVSNKSSALSSGCGFEYETLLPADYQLVAPGALVPWAFYKHNIPSAWNYTTGKGITIAIIDSGLSAEQNLFTSNFNSGYSSGRTLTKFGTYIDSFWPWSTNYDGVNDKCGHGTSMAAVATAPRNKVNLPVGVAYNANLVTYRAVKNVVINDYHEIKGVADALIALGKRNDIKIVSMSIGWPFTINKIKDAITYAHNKGKMIFTAGGTSTSFTSGFGVIFPATMEQTIAVTGVKENQTTKACDVCHKGNKIDFTFQMQRTNGTDSTIPVLGYYSGKTDYVGGSSVATAATAGIAALIWSKYPNWSREQVFLKMKQSSQFYPTRNSNFGFGTIDVLKAVQ